MASQTGPHLFEATVGFSEVALSARALKELATRGATDPPVPASDSLATTMPATSGDRSRAERARWCGTRLPWVLARSSRGPSPQPDTFCELPEANTERSLGRVRKINRPQWCPSFGRLRGLNLCWWRA